jgi:membrane-associated phospholipid phosphatase
MFQTEPVLWLQSFESPAVNMILGWVTFLGYSFVYSILIMILAYGYRIRPTLCLIIGMMICGLMTAAGKNGLKYPRPSDVDARIVEPGSDEQPVHLTERGGATRFFSLIPDLTLERVRAQPEWSYGIPSGHVSLAVTFFVGLALFFRSTIVLAFSLVWIPLMAISRMYLGRHFIADVLAGVLVGLVAVSLAYFLSKRLLQKDESEKENSSLSYIQNNFALAVLVATLIILVPFVAVVDPEIVGQLASIFVVCYLFRPQLLEFDGGSLIQRVLRVVVVVVAFSGTSWLVNTLLEMTPFEDNSVAILLSAFTIFLLTFALLLGACKILKLNKEQTRVVPSSV